MILTKWGWGEMIRTPLAGPNKRCGAWKAIASGMVNAIEW
jgi:hypothetical protein